MRNYWLTFNGDQYTIIVTEDVTPKVSRIVEPGGNRITSNTFVKRMMTHKQAKLDEALTMHVPYYTTDDFDELQRWPKAKCDKFVVSLCSREIDLTGLFTETCPWCIANNYHDSGSDGDCRRCTYGKRHGKCGSDFFNTWDTIVTLMRSSQNSIIWFNWAPPVSEEINKIGVTV